MICIVGVGGCSDCWWCQTSKVPQRQFTYCVIYEYIYVYIPLLFVLSSAVTGVFVYLSLLLASLDMCYSSCSFTRALISETWEESSKEKDPGVDDELVLVFICDVNEYASAYINYNESKNQ